MMTHEQMIDMLDVLGELVFAQQEKRRVVITEVNQSNDNNMQMIHARHDQTDSLTVIMHSYMGLLLLHPLQLQWLLLQWALYYALGHQYYCLFVPKKVQH